MDILMFMMDGMRLVSKKTVFQAQLFSVQESEVVYPTGKKVIHHDVLRDPSASIFALTSKYEIYLIRQYRYLLGRDTLEAVAGMVDPGETPLTCAKRELKEEAGITARQWELLLQVDAAASITRIQNSIFLARELEISKAANDESENIEVIKMPLSHAVEKIFTGEITTTSTIIGIMMLDKLRKEKKI